MSDVIVYNRFTVKELGDYCNRLCEEGHGNAPVQIQFGDSRVRDADVEKVELQDDKLMVMMEAELS